jgi:hypothetical protein
MGDFKRLKYAEQRPKHFGNWVALVYDKREKLYFVALGDVGGLIASETYQYKKDALQRFNELKKQLIKQNHKPLYW